MNNRTDKRLADDFIASQIQRFGLLGSNVDHNPASDFPNVARQAGSHYSVGQTFQFGYNGEAFGFRKSSTCMFWTEHAEPSRKPESVKSEMLAAAKSIVSMVGEVKLLYSGSLSCHGIIQTFGQAHLPMTVIAPQFDLVLAGEARLVESNFPDLRFVPLELTKVELKDLILKTASSYRGVDFWQTLGVAIQSRVGGAFIFESHFPKVVDQNFDKYQKAQVGPSNFCLEELESHYESGRAMRVFGSSGIPSYFMATPELLPALLDLILERGEVADGVCTGELAFAKHLEIECAQTSEELRSFIDNLETELRSRSPKSAEAWLTPICKLPLSKLKLETCRVLEGVYGSVL